MARLVLTLTGNVANRYSITSSARTRNASGMAMPIFESDPLVITFAQTLALAMQHILATTAFAGCRPPSTSGNAMSALNTIAVASLLLGLQVAIAVADGPPKLDLAPTGDAANRQKRKRASS